MCYLFSFLVIFLRTFDSSWYDCAPCSHSLHFFWQIMIWCNWKDRLWTKALFCSIHFHLITNLSLLPRLVTAWECGLTWPPPSTSGAPWLTGVSAWCPASAPTAGTSPWTSPPSATGPGSSPSWSSCPASTWVSPVTAAVRIPCLAPGSNARHATTLTFARTASTQSHFKHKNVYYSDVQDD